MRYRGVSGWCLFATLLGAEHDAQAQARAGDQSTDQSLTAVSAVQLSAVAGQGNTVFSQRELDALTEPYTREPVTFEGLQQLRHELSRQYAERGYVTSGVVIPEQRVADGVVVLNAIEGELTAIEVSGNRRLRNGTIERRVQHYVHRPLNIADLQAGLDELQKDPQVERVNGERAPRGPVRHDETML